MALKIETFSNVTGSSALFKALGHPLAQPGLARMIGSMTPSFRSWKHRLIAPQQRIRIPAAPKHFAV